MNLDEIFDSRFPHATFHDAEIQRVSVDYTAREAVFDCFICIGNPDALDEETREDRQRGRLIFSGLLYCAIDPPAISRSLQQIEGVIRVSDDGPIVSEEISERPLPGNLPEGALAHWFFIDDWNAFIRIVALNARFEWDGALSESGL